MKLEEINKLCKVCDEVTRLNKYFIGHFPVPTVSEHVCLSCQDWIREFGI